MNISVFTHYFTPEIGAPSSRIHEMSRRWQLSNHDVEVVTCFPNHPTGRLYQGYNSDRYYLEKIDGFNVHRNWTYITPNKGFLKKSLGHFSFLPSALCNSVSRLNCPNVTIGTSPTFFAAMAANRAAKQYGCPFIMEVRDLWPACFSELGVVKQPLFIKLLEKWELSLYRQADRVVTVTESFRENLIDRGIPASKVVTIYNGADEEFWQPENGMASELRSKYKLNGKFVVLYIGAHGISQALNQIIDAASEVRHIDKIHFLFVGEGADKEKLVKKVEELGLTNVTFVDPVCKNEVKNYYALANLCLVPLRNIPLFKAFIPSKIFEMMAMKKPILASLDGEAANILNRSGGAVVTSPENNKDLARELIKLYENPLILSKMSQAGRDFVIKEFSRRSLAEKYIEVMREVIKEKKSR